jgi:uncharacterized protein involved in outer membrane biogenesis
VKILLIVTGSVVAFLLLAALGLALILDPMVKRVAQDKGSEALGVPVEIRDADASLFGRLSIEGLSAANPQGFQEPRAFRFDSLSAKARLRSIFEDVVEIKEVRLQRPELTIEFVGARSNLKAILDRLAPSCASAPTASPAASRRRSRCRPSSSATSAPTKAPPRSPRSWRRSCRRSGPKP